MLQKRTLLIAMLLSLGVSAFAGDMNWSGRYRFEGMNVSNPRMNSARESKSYLLHHMVLQPKMIAADGFNIMGRFDILNQSTTTPNQVGEFIGSGVGTATPTNSDNSNTLAKNNNWGPIQVSQMYLSWVQEYGTFLAGRMPLHFGLGISMNSGDGEFDHFFDTRDGVGYRILMGNLSFFPIYGKTYKGAMNKEDDVNDYILQVQYQNPETDLTLGVMWDLRISTTTDAPAGASGYGGTGATQTSNWNTKMTNLFLKRGFDEKKWQVGTEASFMTGQTGVQNSGGTNITLDAYAVAFELDYAASEKWNWNMKFGIVSGDNISSTTSYEGYALNRNYNVGLLLFNHPLGQYDMFQTTMAGRGTNPTNTVDTDAVSNAMYISPAFTYTASQKWAWDARVVYATLNADPIVGKSVARDLGVETDFGMMYTANDRVHWKTDVGLLFPGEAFGGGTLGYDKQFCYGVSSKIAIGF